MLLVPLFDLKFLNERAANTVGTSNRRGTGSIIVDIGSMHIICPHCTTSYAIDLATLGAAGRTVRCSRCREVWLARPEDAVDMTAPVPAMAEAGAQDADDAAAEWEAMAREDDSEAQEIPVVDSPQIPGAVD